MPAKSKAQFRFLMSDNSPLTKSQKEEWKMKTSYNKIPEHVQGAAKDVLKSRGKSKTSKTEKSEKVEPKYGKY